MTPQEKASQLIVDNQLKVRSLDYNEAVQCAIVMVHEIIDAIDWHEYEAPNDQLNYWFEVKKILENQLKVMTLRKALLILESYQKWRLGDEYAQKTEFSKLTEAINTILQYHIGNTKPLKEHIGESTKMIDHIVDVNKMVMFKKVTAIEWLVKKISNELIGEIPMHRWDEIRDVVQQAKALEKSQIAKAQSYAISHADMTDNKGYFDCEQYYNKTFGGQGSPNTTTSPTK